MPSEELSRVNNIQFRLHPRVFEALGTRLVTNDIVAIIELVKNSYDAMATRVDVRFKQPNQADKFLLEIEDNGTGMTRDIIENVWAVVATPYRLEHPISKHKGRIRRVSGDKGLGRLSSARLGNNLELTTKSNLDSCWRLNVSWNNLASAESLDECFLTVEPCREEWLNGTGTIIHIPELISEWPEEKIEDLREQLSRLVSPFTEVEDFKIWFLSSFDDSVQPIEIKPSEFLSYPPYKITGSVDKLGRLKASYIFSSPISERLKEIKQQLRYPAYEKAMQDDDLEQQTDTSCGSFEFEIRTWDLDSDSIGQIADRFDSSRTIIRDSLRNYKGISLYRDGILVLPKTKSARDWLGLDIRRVSRVGVRLSTSQLVGFVSISADGNRGLIDTSDRERLEANQASEDFEDLLKQIVEILEEQRSKDREADHREPPFRDLFEGLSVDPLIEQLKSLSDRNALAEETLPIVEEHQRNVENAVDQIQKRLYYYSRLASLGTISAMIVHEVRNHTTTLGRLTRTVRRVLDNGIMDVDLKSDLDLAEKSISTIERLADRFAPLASRATRPRRKDSILEEIIADTLALRAKEINQRNINVRPITINKTVVPIDPGELMAIFLNLVDNSIYWLSRSNTTDRTITFRIERREKFARVYIQIDDSGPGIQNGDEERIFWPGITQKPDGLGMGLTVAAEIISQYGGNLNLIKPGILGGASFGFDLPLK